MKNFILSDKNHTHSGICAFGEADAKMISFSVQVSNRVQWALAELKENRTRPCLSPLNVQNTTFTHMLVMAQKIFRSASVRVIQRSISDAW